ncbi:MAG: hypothetical protein AB7O39_11750 [Flavobacteriaceae bacterium]
MSDAFAAGQVWRAVGRPQDPEPLLLILAVIPNEIIGPVYSIAMTGVRIRNPAFEGGVQTILPHAPVTQEVLADAVIELVREDGPTSAHPDFAEAYSDFRELYDAGEGGVFTISVPEILDMVEAGIAFAQSTSH